MGDSNSRPTVYKAAGPSNLTGLISVGPTRGLAADGYGRQLKLQLLRPVEASGPGAVRNATNGDLSIKWLGL